MRPTRQTPIEPHPDTDPVGVLDLQGHDPAETLDENLHYGWAWHRYRYCFRRSTPLRVLDAGCGTGRSSVAAARLNAGADVLGVDASAGAVAVGRDRARNAGLAHVAFAIHDLEAPPPGAWGRFDFVICRKVLGHAGDPARVLAHLAGCLDPRGLLLATFPSREGRRAPRALRQAVEALVPTGASLEKRTRIGLDVVQSLRPDHPILEHLARTQAGAPVPSPLSALSGETDLVDSLGHTDELARVVLDALIEQREWTLDETAALLEQSGLGLLHVATPGRWQSDRAFGPGPLPESLRGRIEAADPARLSRLIDALDPSALDDEYALYACLAGHEPEIPSWPRTRHTNPASFDHLIPHLTGLARPDKLLPTGSASQGRTLYRTVAGALGELDRIAVLRLGAVDGQSSCGFIDRKLASHTRSSDNTAVRQECWITLADSGLILLEPPGTASL
jgi:SAM-dependent methyltransferase